MKMLPDVGGIQMSEFGELIIGGETFDLAGPVVFTRQDKKRYLVSPYKVPTEISGRIYLSAKGLNLILLWLSSAYCVSVAERIAFGAWAVQWAERMLNDRES